jgi:hypothetical protein
MESRILTANQVIAYSQLLVAVHAGLKVRILWGNDQLVEGTLRHLTQRKDDSGYLHGGTDVRDAWVRITTKQGYEVWYLFTELVQAHQDGALAFG